MSTSIGIGTSLITAGATFVKATWFESIGSGTTGTITTVPDGAEILLNSLGGGVSAVVSGITNGVPDYTTVKTSGGTVVTTTLDSSGNYALSGTPSSYPVAIIYVYRVQLYEFDHTKTLTDFEFTGTLGVSSLNGVIGALTLAGTTNQISINESGGTFTLSGPQDLHTSATPNFNSLTLSNALTLSNSSSERLLATDSSKNVVSVASLTSWVAGTTNRLSVTDDLDGTITLDIDSGYVGQTSINTLGTVSTGTWNADTLAVAHGGTGQTSYADGQLLIGNSTGNTLAKGTITGGTSINVTNGSGTITIAAAQAIGTGDSPSFNNLTVTGNLVVEGTTVTVESTEVTVADNIVIYNYGEVGGGVTSGTSGFQVDRGTATDYQVVFRESDDILAIGPIGSLQAVATREDSPTDTGVAYWSNSSVSFETDAGFIWDSAVLTLADLNPSNGAAAIRLLEVQNTPQYGFELIYDGTTANITRMGHYNGTSTFRSDLEITRSSGNVNVLTKLNVGTTTAASATFEVKSPSTNVDVVKIRRSSDSNSLVEITENSDGDGLIDLYDVTNTIGVRLHSDGESYFIDDVVFGGTTATTTAKLEVVSGDIAVSSTTNDIKVYVANANSQDHGFIAERIAGGTQRAEYSLKSSASGVYYGALQHYNGTTLTEYLSFGASTSHGNGYLNIDGSGNIQVTGTVDGVDIAGLLTDVDGFPDELKNLTTAEIQQLENIDSLPISNTKWGYLSNLDQGLTTTSDVDFATITTSGIGYFQAGDSTPGLSSGLSAEFGDSDGSNAGTLKIWGYTAGNYGLIQATTTNLHIDTSNASGQLFLNYYAGNGVKFGDGANSQVAYMTSSGHLSLGHSATPEGHLHVEGSSPVALIQNTSSGNSASATLRIWSSHDGSPTDNADAILQFAGKTGATTTVPDNVWYMGLDGSTGATNFSPDFVLGFSPNDWGFSDNNFFEYASNGRLRLTATTSEHLRIGANSTSSYSPYVSWYYNSAMAGYIQADAGGFDIVGEDDLTIRTTGVGDEIIFTPENSEFMRMVDGRLAIKNTTPQSLIDIQTATSSATRGMILQGAGNSQMEAPLLIKYPVLTIFSGETSPANDPAMIAMMGINVDAASYQPSLINFSGTRSTSSQLSGSTFTAVTTGDLLGGLVWTGDDGTDLRTYGAEITAKVATSTSANLIPMTINYNAYQHKFAAGAATTYLDRMTIADGGVTLEGTAGVSLKLNNVATADYPTGSAGDILFDTTLTEFSGYNGTAWVPVSGKVKVGTFTGRTTTGATAVTGVGFRPRLIQISLLHPNNTSRAITGYGYYDGTSVWCCYVDTSDVRSSTSNIIEWYSNTSSAQQIASPTSLDSDGFTVNFTTVNGTAYTYGYIAYR